MENWMIKYVKDGFQEKVEITADNVLVAISDAITEYKIDLSTIEVIELY